MKKFSIIFLLILCAKTFSQSLEIEYFQNYKIVNKNSFNLFTRATQATYSKNTFKYKLLANDKYSLYENEEINLKIDSSPEERAVVSETGDSTITVLPAMEFNKKYHEKIYFNDFNKGIIKAKINLSLVDYFIKDSIPKYTWIYTNETQEILGYTCKKAISKYYGSELNVWYAVDLSFAVGPQEISGVPGAILKVETNNFEIIAFKVNLNKYNVKIIEPEFNNTMTYKEVIEDNIKVNALKKSKAKPKEFKFEGKVYTEKDIQTKIIKTGN